MGDGGNQELEGSMKPPIFNALYSRCRPQCAQQWPRHFSVWAGGEPGMFIANAIDGQHSEMALDTRW